MPILDEQERAALLTADSELSELQEALEAAANSNALDAELLQRLQRTAHDAAGRMNRNLPPQVDADARDEIRRRLIDLLTLQRSDELGPLDLADRALVEAEAVRHIVRDLLQEQPPIALRDGAAVIALLEEWLPTLTVRQVAELVGLSERQLQRKRQEDGNSTPRMQLVARLVAILRHAWTDQGVYAWFLRKRPEFDGTRPLDLIGDPANERALLLAARSGRVQGGL